MEIFGLSVCQKFLLRPSVSLTFKVKQKQTGRQMFPEMGRVVCGSSSVTLVRYLSPDWPSAAAP